MSKNYDFVSLFIPLHTGNILIFIKKYQNVLTLYKYTICSEQSGQPDLFFLMGCFYERIKKITGFDGTG